MESYQIAILIWLLIVFILWKFFDINIFTAIVGHFEYSKGKALVNRAKNCDFFDWQYESHWLTSTHEGPGETWERKHYEKKFYGASFEETCEKLLAKLADNYINNKENHKKDLEEIYELFEEYSLPTFENDKTAHLTNILNVLFNPDLLDAPDLAEELAIKTRNVYSASLEGAVRKMKANNAASKLKRWKSKVRANLKAHDEESKSVEKTL